MASENKKRIAKNTMFLYIRMFLIMGVSLYTSRVVLDKLGVVDYSLYGVVGGVVSMLSFLNGTLTIGTSRFITYELGQGDRKTTFRHVRHLLPCSFASCNDYHPIDGNGWIMVSVQ